MKTKYHLTVKNGYVGGGVGDILLSKCTDCFREQCRKRKRLEFR